MWHHASKGLNIFSIWTNHILRLGASWTTLIPVLPSTRSFFQTSLKSGPNTPPYITRRRVDFRISWKSWLLSILACEHQEDTSKYPRYFIETIHPICGPAGKSGRFGFIGRGFISIFNELRVFQDRGADPNLRLPRKGIEHHNLVGLR